MRRHDHRPAVRHARVRFVVPRRPLGVAGRPGVCPFGSPVHRFPMMLDPVFVSVRAVVSVGMVMRLGNRAGCRCNNRNRDQRRLHGRTDVHVDPRGGNGVIQRRWPPWPPRVSSWPWPWPWLDPWPCPWPRPEGATTHALSALTRRPTAVRRTTSCFMSETSFFLRPVALVHAQRSFDKPGIPAIRIAGVADVTTGKWGVARGRSRGRQGGPS